MMTPARMHMIVVFVIMASASLVESCPISCILYPEICGEVGRCINGCCQYPNSRMNPNGQMSPNSGMNPNSGYDYQKLCSHVSDCGPGEFCRKGAGLPNGFGV